MLYVFVPYYTPNTKGFDESLSRQTVPFRLITRDRKQQKIMWTESVRDFQKEIKRYLGTKDTDVICIMNNDVLFDKDLFRYGNAVIKNEVYIANGCGVKIDWKHKRFDIGNNNIDSFIGRCFFMTLGDFKKIKFSKLLPHALADIDFGIRVVKKLRAYFIDCEFVHPDHNYEKVNKFSLLSYENPILWSIFLLKHPNIYTPLNILKAWI